MHIRFIWITLLFVGVGLSVAQAQCPAFEQFKKSYEEGNLDDALNLMQQVEPCLKRKDLSSQDMIEFYKYKTFLYQDLDQASKAEENIQLFMRKILRKNPDYSPKQNLPEQKKPDFYELYNRHRYWPTYYLGLKAGVNYTQINDSHAFSVDQSQGKNRSKYQNVYSIRLAASIELPILRRNTRLYFAPELAFSNNIYQFNDILLDYAKVKFRESQSWLQVPLLAKYYFQREDKRSKTVKNKFQPFVVGGISLDFLAKSSAIVSRQDILPNGNTREQAPETFGDLAQQRKRLNYSAVLGGGVKFKNFFHTGWDMYLEGRYNYGIPNLVKTGSRGANQNLVYDFGYIDNDFHLNSIVISLGFLMPNYNPKPVGISGKPLTIDFGNTPSPKKKKK